MANTTKTSIKQPKNVKAKSVLLKYNKSFDNIRSKQFYRAQKEVDSEVLRLSSPYVPFNDGILIKSGILNTVIGSGLVKYATPYARKLYYNPKFNFQGAPIRGAYWFEKMKAVSKETIRKKAGDKLK